MLSKFKRIIKSKFQEDFDTLRVNSALPLRNANKIHSQIDKLLDVEFKVFSQFGDDGIITWILDNIQLKKKIKFIEIGCANYQECNSKFQLLTKNISVDGYDYNRQDIENIKFSYIFQKYDLNVFHKKITKEYIIDVFNFYYLEKKNLFEYVLSLDIDGNDYWILKNINLKKLKPVLVILEYNSVFGFEQKITIPYNANFNRNDFSNSGCIYGASLNAFKQLMNDNDYSFLGTNSAGNNAYFVRSDLEFLNKIANVTHHNSSFDECLKITNFDKSKTKSLIENDLKKSSLIYL